MIRTPWLTLQTLPVTLAVAAGPLITVIYHLTRSPDAKIGTFSPAQAIRGLLCAVMFLSLFLSRRLHLLLHGLVRPLLFLAACAILTSFAGPYPYENIVFAVKMIFLALVFANAFHLAERGPFGERWLVTCAWAILLMTALCISVGLVTGRTVTAYGSRYATAGLINQPSVASSLLLSTLAVFITLIPDRTSAIAGTMLLFASLLFTMCRNSVIAAAAVACSSLLISLVSRERRALWRRTLVFVGILLLLAGIGLGTTAGVDLIERFKDLNPAQGTGSGRYVFWRIALGHIVNRPTHVQLLGEGVGSSRSMMEQQFGMPIGSHNDWLDIVNDFGLCGLLGISWWYMELARFTWRFRGRPHGLFQGACAILIVLSLISIGTGGVFGPSWAFSYATLGFWAGRTKHSHPARGPSIRSLRIGKLRAGSPCGNIVSPQARPQTN